MAASGKLKEPEITPAEKPVAAEELRQKQAAPAQPESKTEGDLFQLQGIASEKDLPSFAQKYVLSLTRHWFFKRTSPCRVVTLFD